MKLNNKILFAFLTLAGAIPFISLPALQLYSGENNFQFLQPYLLYGLSIICFLCGSLWSNILHSENQISNKTKFILILLSNLILLFALFSILSFQPIYQIFIQMIIFGFLLFLDRILFAKKLLDFWYFKLRIIITLIVITCYFLLLNNISS
jgi:hypothetical protein